MGYNETAVKVKASGNYFSSQSMVLREGPKRYPSSVSLTTLSHPSYLANSVFWVRTPIPSLQFAPMALLLFFFSGKSKTVGFFHGDSVLPAVHVEQRLYVSICFPYCFSLIVPSVFWKSETLFNCWKNWIDRSFLWWTQQFRSLWLIRDTLRTSEIFDCMISASLQIF